MGELGLGQFPLEYSDRQYMELSQPHLYDNTDLAEHCARRDTETLNTNCSLLFECIWSYFSRALNLDSLPDSGPVDTFEYNKCRILDDMMR